MRICSGAGCLRAVPDGVRYCDEHKPVHVQQDTAIREHHATGRGVYDAVLDGLRKGTRWQRIRASVLQANPFCVRCELDMAKEVDHRVPADIAIQQAHDSGRYPLDRYAGYYLKSNLQGLCRGCHACKTIEDKAHVGPWPSVMAAEDAAPKRAWTF